MKYKLKFLTKDRVKELASGEIIEQKLFNMKTAVPVPNGLFCQKVFGPLHNFTCLCSPEKKVHNKGRICPDCGIPYIKAQNRRVRSGYIRLANPHMHPFAISSLADILKISARELFKAIKGTFWIHWEPDNESGTIIIYDQLYKVSVGERVTHATRKEWSPLGVYNLINSINLVRTCEFHKEMSQISVGKIQKAWRKSARFMQMCITEGIGLTDLFITYLPVMPPDLRPLFLKEHEVTIMNPKNDIYRSLIWRKNRSQFTMDPEWKKFPSFLKKDIIRHEASSAQEALIGLLIKGYKSIQRVPMKSLLQDLVGKTGHLRNKMAGKRVDYSGRTVITPGPKLQLNEVGIPRKMAIHLFDLWIMKELSQKYHMSYRRMKILFKKDDPLVYKTLDNIIADKVVILNRQPTLHRMGILCFNIHLHDGKSLLLHPMVCAAFNADFDGDQMAVHVPLSEDVVKETKQLMYPVDNLLSPADSAPIMLPSHEMVIGLYDMTCIQEGHSRLYLDRERAKEDYERDILRLNDPIEIFTPERFGGGSRKTCVGRLLLEDVFGVPIEDPLTKGNLKRLISDSYNVIGKECLVQALDYSKEMGYAHVTRMGFSFGIGDFSISAAREKKIEEARNYGKDLFLQKNEGRITEEDRIERKIRKWIETIEFLQEDFVQESKENNPLMIMLKTGARVSMTQVSQLVVSKGMQASAQGKILENPIENCLVTGLTPHEFFRSCYGARKSMADKKVVTPLAGYMARLLVNAARDFYIADFDCGHTGEGIDIRRCDAVGRTTCSGEVIEPNHSSEYVRVRSPVFCRTRHGICSVCYGFDPSKRQRVALGVPVGVIAAQSLTEPCTQLSLRSFHVSGAAELKDSALVIRARYSGRVRLESYNDSIMTIKVGRMTHFYHKNIARLLVKENEIVLENEPLVVYTSKNLANEDIGRTLIVLQSYYERRKRNPRLHAAVVAKDYGTVELRVEEEKNISVYINGQCQGSVEDAPVFVYDGEYVRKGQFLSYGEVSLRDYDEINDLELPGNIFVQRMQYLYEQEGIHLASCHLEMIFRAMTELVDDGEGTLGLFRESDPGKRRLFGITHVGRVYPSWLKAISFGYVEENLIRASNTFAVSRDLPSERILCGQYPLFDIPT